MNRLNRGTLPPGRQTATKLALLLALGGGLFTAGCGRAAVTVWRLQLRSPDGRWSALAQTLEIGGPGIDGLATNVYLEQTNMPRTRAVVLAFSCNGPVPHPYTLDNKANAGGTIDLAMKWLSPTRLRVTYRSALGATLNFQAVRYQGVAISLTDLSASGPAQDDEHSTARAHRATEDHFLPPATGAGLQPAPPTRRKSAPPAPSIRTKTLSGRN